MSIQLVTYANQTVTPTNDAIIYERAIDQNGIFYGCNVTVSGNEVNITGGYGIVCGREFTIQSEAIAVTLAPSGTLEGRLYVRLDLADADNPIQLLTATGNTLPSLEQDDDVNYTNGTYEMELATFTVGVSSLSDVVETFETIVGSKNGTWKEITITNTMTTGTGGTVKAYRCNNLLMLTFTEIYKNATTNAGTNLYESTISGLPSTPDCFSCITFSGSRAIVFQVVRSGSSATLTARVLADNFPADLKVSSSCITAIIMS